MINRKFLVLLLGIVSQTFAEMRCIDTNGDNIFNKCLMVEHKMFLHVVYEFVNTWINPKLSAMIIIIVLLILPIIILDNLDSMSIQMMLRRFGKVKLHLLNYLHRICFVLCLNVIMFTLFKQKRPCTCSMDDGLNWKVYGSLYGMPSMDTFNGAIMASTLFELAPFNQLASRLIAVGVIPCIAINGILLGNDSISQAIAGCMMGIIFHIYSTRLPQFMIGFDALLSAALGMTVLLFDTQLIYTLDSENNLFAWWIWGFSFQLFAVILIFRHHTYRSYLPLLFSLSYMAENDYTFRKENGENFDFLVNRDHHVVSKGLTTTKDMFALSDYGFTLTALVVFVIFNFLSFCVSHYGWLTRIGSNGL